MTKNIFWYWSGPKPQIICDLETILDRSCVGRDYSLHKINDNTISDYVDITPKILEASNRDKSDYFRVKLLHKFGGIWVDADVLVFSDFDWLFSLNKRNQGFFVGVPFRGRMRFNPAIIGCRPNTHFYSCWIEHNERALENNDHINKHISERHPFGPRFLNHYAKERMFLPFSIIDGEETQMEPFMRYRSEILTREASSKPILSFLPAMVHLCRRNWCKYEYFSVSQRKKTRLYQLLQQSPYFSNS